MFNFLIGVLLVLIQVSFEKILAKRNKAKLWPNSLLILASNALILFSIAWGYASIMEHEIQAAVSGLIMFAAPGVIIAIIAYRIIKAQDNKVPAK